MSHAKAWRLCNVVWFLGKAWANLCGLVLLPHPQQPRIGAEAERIHNIESNSFKVAAERTEGVM